MNSFFTKQEEIANAITHGIGTGLSFAAVTILTILAALYGTAWHIVSFSVFGASLVILYSASTLYHSLAFTKLNSLFRKLDHMSIFLLIAGTYTPFCLVALKGWIGWTLFGIVWGGAVAGIVLKAFYLGRNEILSTLLYIILGWVIVIAIKPLYDSLSLIAFLFLMMGGVFYTAGTFFFMKDRISYFHSIWHIFVLAGSIFHFFSVLLLLFDK